MTLHFKQSAKDYERVGKILHYLEAHAVSQPPLDTLAKVAGLSPFHLQRLFKRWVGLSPKQFLDVISAEEAKRRLRASQSVLDVSLDVGLSSPSRLHDLLIKVEAMTPGEYKTHGASLTIRYGVHPTMFGDCLIAVTERGICKLAFIGPVSRKILIAELKADWRLATVKEDMATTKQYIAALFDRKHSSTDKLFLLIKGTQFQIKVWQALLSLPRDAIVSYQDVAIMIHHQKAHRAVANAIAHNPIGYIIPCHRVIRNMGTFGGYRWGLPRKKAIMAWELSA